MINNLNSHKFKKINDYPNTMKKSIPISIVTGKDTIFIKTKPNKLTYNYLNNGNRIKNNKAFINAITVNQSVEVNDSLKNTFSLQKSNYIKSANGTILEGKNLNSSKLNDLIKKKQIPSNNNNNNSHYRGTNSFIKMYRRNNNANHSNINNNIIFNKNSNSNNSSNNHIFNFYNFLNINQSSTRERSRIKNKLEKNIDHNIKNAIKKNNFNYTYIMDKNRYNYNNNIIQEKRTNSNAKRQSMNRTINSKDNNYNNNLSNANYSKRDYISFRPINTCYENEKENKRYNMEKRRPLYYPYNKYTLENKKSKNNKYIYSIEKKKEKSLAERRHKAKKPISYLIKNINQFEKNKILKNNIIININNINNGKNSNEYSKEKDKTYRTISAKRSNYEINNYNKKSEINKNYGIENKIIIKRNINDNYSYNIGNNFTTISNNERKNLYKKDNLLRNNTIENRISPKNHSVINNNNYYNISNTFIFETAGHKLLHYDLAKLLPNTKNNNSMNINISDISNYNTNIQNNYKTNSDLEKKKKEAIKNLNNKIKNEINEIKNENQRNKNSKNNDFINVVIDNNNNENNFNIQKFSSYKLSNILKNKINQNHIKIITNTDNLYISNLVKKESNKNNTNNSNKKQSQRANCNNININENISKDLVIKEYNNKKKNKNINENKKVCNNKDNVIIRKNKLNEQRSIGNVNNRYNTFYVQSLNKRKSDNINNFENKVRINKYNIKNIFKNTEKNTANNSIKKYRGKSLKRNNKDSNVSKDKIKENDNKISENKIFDNKVINLKNKNNNKNNNTTININHINNSQKIKELKDKKVTSSIIDKKKNKNNTLINKKKDEDSKKIINNKKNDKDIPYKNYETNENNNHENVSLINFEDDNLLKREKSEKYYSSFELISFSENKINEYKKNIYDNDDNNEFIDNDNFDDINTIIRKIDFYNIRLNNPNDIFNTTYNNNIYNNYTNLFNKRFNDYIQNNSKYKI